MLEGRQTGLWATITLCVKSYLLVLLLLSFLLSMLILLKPITTTEDTFFQNLRLQHQQNIIRNKRLSLIRFFRHYKCPSVNYTLIENYLYAADQNNLDYRLLPALSLIESTCAKHYPYATANIFGWDSARTQFPSIPASIDFISKQLAGGRHYQGKTLINKLLAYNPNSEYGPRVISLMGEISNEPIN